MSLTPNFSLPTQSAANMLKSADGMKSYDASTGWGGFAEKNSEQYDSSFKNDLTLKNESSFNKGEKDGNFSSGERALLQAQLHWDVSPNATNKGPDSVKPDTVQNALNSLLAMAGIDDVTGDGKFNEADVQNLAARDGNADTFSSKDIDLFYQELMGN